MTYFRKQLLASWEMPGLLTILLYPLSLLYAACMALRKLAYRIGLFASTRAAVPVVIVGNLTVGGSGKTPLVIHLVQELTALGYKPGVISRGYGGNAGSYPLLVTSATAVDDCGDEAALIVRRTRVPMAVGPKRTDNIEKLLSRNDCDVVISDDGLQHYALQRDIEICVVDETVAGKNKHLLPAGPYREGEPRLNTVDFVVRHVTRFDAGTAGQFQMALQAGKLRQLLDEAGSIPFPDGSRVHALAGIGQPARFFTSLENLGLDIIPHAFPDHHRFSANDIDFDDELPVVMTEKDAVKCLQICAERHWCLPVDAKLQPSLAALVGEQLNELSNI